MVVSRACPGAKSKGGSVEILGIAQLTSPGGTAENSPALQRRYLDVEADSVPL